ncbi:MAG: ABC transporter permease subunit [Phycisphaerales bacterium]|nr:ABC transporter permease subunit [Phycisphaerales bacterium]
MNFTHRLRILLACLVFVVSGCASESSKQPDAAVLTIGSKKFTESAILGEMLKHIARHEGYASKHTRDLGTRVLFNALKIGGVDAYVDYTGTLSQVLLSGKQLVGIDELRVALRDEGILMSRPLGFRNNYVLGIREDLAKQRKIRTISDLKKHPDLVLAFSNEFMDREDGWPSLRDRYQLPHENVKGMDHDLAYRGMERRAIHVTDLYSTDAEIRYYNLRALKDDLHHFPDYEAVILYRADLKTRAPNFVKKILRLENRIAEEAMIKMNARAKLSRVRDTVVSADFLDNVLGIKVEVGKEDWLANLRSNTYEHLRLVAISLFAAIVIAIPLGIVAAGAPGPGQTILGVVGIIQTIPALALLVFMIPIFRDIGSVPAIAALFLYSLLPIVRNTYTGLHDISPALKESAAALGLSRFARLRLIELPMASRTILAGIKTSAVINIGTATLGALIGAGGYGQPILTGIRLNDVSLILQGAIPAAALALLVQAIFEIAERIFVSKGLRIKPIM